MPDCDVSITGKVQTAAAFATHQPESPGESRIGASGCLDFLHAYHRAMKTEEAADVLRNLIQTLEDGKEGFRLAADAIDNRHFLRSIPSEARTARAGYDGTSQ